MDPSIVRCQRWVPPAVRGHIQANYGNAYLPNTPNSYTSGKSAQEAHEAIRPTDVKYTPDRVA